MTTTDSCASKANPAIGRMPRPGELSGNLDVSTLVDADGGLIDRSVYTGGGLYKQEMPRIFARSWFFRADAGATKMFTRTYHGWSFDLEGALQSVPNGQAYPEDSEKKDWSLVDKSMPDDVKDAQRLYNLRTFGPSGIFEADDGENWSEVQAISHGFVTNNVPLNFQMGIGSEHGTAPTRGRPPSPIPTPRDAGSTVIG
ncbi:hypothetical protein NCCP1664_12390 [Zafaria cholistanensis]|uniref:Uncharacterized protein n=1 Tax=Zafaria cholistanensis TaxID=1682741 RepID=A0A5A7NRK2_9MICC|nr:hypothetical protein [Zafaria cholistanensis]GER22742.1 hypothetical protein NCCP1664_12390 [Zafaria cholistanensis]